MLQLRLNLFGMFNIGAGLNNPLSSHQLDSAEKGRKVLQEKTLSLYTEYYIISQGHCDVHTQIIIHKINA